MEQPFDLSQTFGCVVKWSRCLQIMCVKRLSPSSRQIVTHFLIEPAVRMRSRFKRVQANGARPGDIFDIPGRHGESMGQGRGADQSVDNGK